MPGFFVWFIFIECRRDEMQQPQQILSHAGLYAGHPRLSPHRKQGADGRDLRAFTPVFDGLCPAMTA
jgi:hypothetical protein